MQSDTQAPSRFQKRRLLRIAYLLHNCQPPGGWPKRPVAQVFLIRDVMKQWLEYFNSTDRCIFLQPFTCNTIAQHSAIDALSTDLKKFGPLLYGASFGKAHRPQGNLSAVVDSLIAGTMSSHSPTLNVNSRCATIF